MASCFWHANQLAVPPKHLTPFFRFVPYPSGLAMVRRSSASLWAPGGVIPMVRSWGFCSSLMWGGQTLSEFIQFWTGGNVQNGMSAFLVLRAAILFAYCVPDRPHVRCVPRCSLLLSHFQCTSSYHNVWEYLRNPERPYCRLYDEVGGFDPGLRARVYLNS